jgi:hypothetical protein
MLHATRYMLHATCYMLHATTRYMLHTAPFTLHIVRYTHHPPQTGGTTLATWLTFQSTEASSPRPGATRRTIIPIHLEDQQQTPPVIVAATLPTLSESSEPKRRSSFERLQAIQNNCLDKRNHVLQSFSIGCGCIRAPLSLHPMPRTPQTRHRCMRLQDPLGQFPGPLLSQRQETSRQPSWHRHLYRLAETTGMQQRNPRFQARMLRMWRTQSRRPDVPSSAKSLMPTHHTTAKHGSDTSKCMTYSANTPTYRITSNSASTLASQGSITHTPLPITPQFYNMPQNLIESSKRNSTRNVILAPLQKHRSKRSSGLSKPHLSTLSPNPENPANSGLSKISHTRTNHNPPYH